ncbi:MAG: M67 family metallopeptidase [Treponema sp.]|nr:M67 family metallopeptidase [Treponema sp.]MCL2238275.1 M67 family metallopeptidase [Treponema sp.]
MLKLSQEHEKIIRAEGESAYPNECCGILIGEIDEEGVKTVKYTEAIRNAREDGEQYHRFLITPEDMMQAEITARKRKEDVIGFYHSHPDHPAVPSDYDKEHALPFYSYIIVSVMQKKSKDFKSWELRADRNHFESEKILKEIEND